jgi:hypothetical protein
MRLNGRGTPSDVTFEAAANLSALQYTLVKPAAGVATGPQCRFAACGLGDRGFILQNKPIQFTGAVVRIHGFSQLFVDGAAGAIAPGDMLKSNAAGLGIKTVAAGDYYSAIAMESSTAAGDLIEVLCERGRV